MNKLVRIGEIKENVAKQKYLLTTEDGQEFECGTWYEKKTDAWHVLIPKEGREICGRTYIRVSKVTDSGFEFETKTEHREGLSGGGWKSKMTPEEAAEYEICEKKMAEIKTRAASRVISEEDRLKAEIAKLQAKLATMSK